MNACRQTNFVHHRLTNYICHFTMVSDTFAGACIFHGIDKTLKTPKWAVLNLGDIDMTIRAIIPSRNP